MPYISQDKRFEIDTAIDRLYQILVGLESDDEQNNMEGNINYAITRLLRMIYGEQDSTRYSQINDAIGVLECVKLEFYRTVASPYEDVKRNTNGDVVVSYQPVVTEEVLVIPPKYKNEEK